MHRLVVIFIFVFWTLTLKSEAQELLPVPPYYTSNAKIKVLYDTYTAQAAEIARLSSEVAALKAQIAGMQPPPPNEFETEVLARLTSIETQVTATSSGVSEVSTAVTNTGVKVASIETKTAAVEAKAASIETKVIALAADLPIVVKLIGVNTQFTLTWNDNSTNETGFKIERSYNGGPWGEIATVGANVVTYVDKGLAPGSYSYRLRAYNAAGNSGYSNTASGVL